MVSTGDLQEGVFLQSRSQQVTRDGETYYEHKVWLASYRLAVSTSFNKDEMETWLKENARGLYLISTIHLKPHIYFQFKQDAVLFIIRFKSGELS